VVTIATLAYTLEMDQRDRTGAQHGLWALAAAAGICGALSGCVALPVTALEQLDEHTGTTLTRLARPVELLASSPRGAGLDPFAYVAPFETNRMGERRAFLWISAPHDSVVRVSQPTLLVDGESVRLGAAVDTASTGLRAWPYDTPAPWSAVWVFELDTASLRALLTARRLSLTDASIAAQPQFSNTEDPGATLRDFGARLGL